MTSTITTAAASRARGWPRLRVGRPGAVHGGGPPDAPDPGGGLGGRGWKGTPAPAHGGPWGGPPGAPCPNGPGVPEPANDEGALGPGKAEGAPGPWKAGGALDGANGDGVGGGAKGGGAAGPEKGGGPEGVGGVGRSMRRAGSPMMSAASAMRS